MTRTLRPLPVPTGDAVLDLLDPLARALDGTGPALLPLAESDPHAPATARRLGVNEPLAGGEDDPADPTALVIATSGSTGAPKGVLLSAGQLAASAGATESRLGGPGHWLLALPAQHIAGMQVLLRAARAGTEPVVLDTAERFTPAAFLAAAQRLPGPRRYVSLVPTQLSRVMADPGAAAAAAKIFDAVLLGGAACPPALLAAARAAGLPVVTTYGMSETCGGCVYDGIPLPGVDVTVNPAGAIVLTGPMVARGYRGAAHHPAFATAGSFVTADAGAVGGDGSLTVTGRLDEIIVTGGEKVAPTTVEAALTALTGIVGAVVAGVPDQEWGQAVAAAVVVEAGAAAPSLPEVRTALDYLPAAARPRRLVVLAALPRLPSGKPDRVAVRDLLRAHR